MGSYLDARSWENVVDMGLGRSTWVDHKVGLHWKLRT